MFFKYFIVVKTWDKHLLFLRAGDEKGGPVHSALQWVQLEGTAVVSSGRDDAERMVLREPAGQVRGAIQHTLKGTLGWSMVLKFRIPEDQHPKSTLVQ